MGLFVKYSVNQRSVPTHFVWCLLLCIISVVKYFLSGVVSELDAQRSADFERRVHSGPKERTHNSSSTEALSVTGHSMAAHQQSVLTLANG